GRSAEMDVSPETLARTTLGALRSGAAVNLEPALIVGDRLDGHLVTGHVDCTGRIIDLRPEAGGVLLKIEVPSSHVRYLAVKGSVAVDGISLTVAAIEGSSAVVHVVPFTRDSTNLRLRRSGDLVNIETDLIAKYVERLLPGNGGRGLTWDQAELLR
nr:riboflavin synthase [bacterium]